MSSDDNDEEQAKRLQIDPFHLEPNYISIPVHPIIFFDLIPGLEEKVPRLPQRSISLMDMEGEKNLLIPFTCSRCKEASSTTSRVPCLCGVICDTCKRNSNASFLSTETLFVCSFCKFEYTPDTGHMGFPPLSTHSHRIVELFDWVTNHCAATCHFCPKSYESIQVLQLHMSECAKQNYKMCVSISCLKPIVPGVSHVCLYNLTSAKEYARVPFLPIPEPIYNIHLIIIIASSVYPPPLPLQGFMDHICDCIAEAPDQASFTFYGERFKGTQCNTAIAVCHEDRMNELINHIHNDDYVGSARSTPNPLLVHRAQPTSYRMYPLLHSF